MCNREKQADPYNQEAEFKLHFETKLRTLFSFEVSVIWLRTRENDIIVWRMRVPWTYFCKYLFTKWWLCFVMQISWQYGFIYGFKSKYYAEDLINGIKMKKWISLTELVYLSPIFMYFINCTEYPIGTYIL